MRKKLANLQSNKRGGNDGSDYPIFDAVPPVRSRVVRGMIAHDSFPVGAWARVYGPQFDIMFTPDGIQFELVNQTAL